MKKTALVLAVALLCGAQIAGAQEIKIKKGKVTMTEAQYYELLDRVEASQAELAKLKSKPTPNSFIDSVSYAIGRDLFNSWNQQNLGINGIMAGQALIDCAMGQNNWTDQMARPLLQRFQHSVSFLFVSDTDPSHTGVNLNMDRTGYSAPAGKHIKLLSRII